MLNITPAVRTALLTVLVRSRDYDAGTMRIGRDGMVTARKDADKTAAGPDNRRWNVAYADAMVCQDGTIREGY